MSTPLAAKKTLDKLYTDVFSEVSAHLPLSYRVATLFSLALTCHTLYETVVPHLLFADILLVGENQAQAKLKELIAKAEAVTPEELEPQGNPSPSHCIQNLCIDTSIRTPLYAHTHSITLLHKLVEIDGLRNLRSLTLHVDTYTVEDNIRWEETFFIPPLALLQSLKQKCPRLHNVTIQEVAQVYQKREWIEQGLFSNQALTTLGVTGTLLHYPEHKLNFSKLPPRIHTLKISLNHPHGAQTFDPNQLMSCTFPCLRTLILDEFDAADPETATQFWNSHPSLERLELGGEIDEKGWFDEVQPGMFPNLKFLKAKSAITRTLLPLVSRSLVGLTVVGTHNAEVPYALRVVAPGGTLPCLRTLGFNMRTKHELGTDQEYEGHDWREFDDQNRITSQGSVQQLGRYIDAGYITSISRAAPHLEELEMMGTSEGTVDSITDALNLFPRLKRLVLSGSINTANPPFFLSSKCWTEYRNYGIDRDIGTVKYAPSTSDEAVNDIAHGCAMLETISFLNMVGELVAKDGISARISRSNDGLVQSIRRVKAWGRIIGKEEEW